MLCLPSVLQAQRALGQLALRPEAALLLPGPQMMTMKAPEVPNEILAATSGNFVMRMQDDTGRLVCVCVCSVPGTEYFVTIPVLARREKSSGDAETYARSDRWAQGLFSQRPAALHGLGGKRTMGLGMFSFEEWREMADFWCGGETASPSTLWLRSGQEALDTSAGTFP